MILNNLANLDSAQNRMEAARKEYEEALEIFQQFAARNPDKFQPDVAQVKALLQAIPKDTAPQPKP